jgi:hypothetical protein
MFFSEKTYHPINFYKNNLKVVFISFNLYSHDSSIDESLLQINFSNNKFTHMGEFIMGKLITTYGWGMQLNQRFFLLK